jgi:hypothetical protein
MCVQLDGAIMSNFKFFYRWKRDPDRRLAALAPQSGVDPFAHPQIASMNLRTLADLPPEQLRDGESSKSVDGLRAARSPSLSGKICVS